MNCFNHPEEVAVASCVDCGKGLCKTCAGLYQIPICNECNTKRNTNDKSLAIKQFIPSLILFIIGFIVGFILQSDSNEDIGSRIMFSIVMGWVLGGTVLGWFKTRSMFKPKVYVNTGMDANAFIHAARLPIRIICAEVVGIVLMPVELIKFIIAIVKSKKISDTINDNKGEN